MVFNWRSENGVRVADLSLLQMRLQRDTEAITAMQPLQKVIAAFPFFLPGVFQKAQFVCRQ